MTVRYWGTAALALLAAAFLAPRFKGLHSGGAPRASARPASDNVHPVSAPEAGPPSGNYLGVIVPEESVDVSSRFEGLLEKVPVQVGDVVKKGQVLAVLEAKALERELAVRDAELLTTRSALRVEELGLVEALTRLRRREDPTQLSVGAISEEEVSTARYEHELAAARRDGAIARVREQEARVAQVRQQLADAVIRAPFDGVVANRYMDPGRRLQPGESILHVLREGARQVRFALPEADARAVTPGLAVDIRVEEEPVTLSGRVSHVAPEVDAASRMVLAIALVEGPASSRRPPAGSVVRVSPLSPPQRPTAQADGH
nr:secretion protein [Myxococcus fulvus]